jgi:uncharacterized protein (DUF1015 family)
VAVVTPFRALRYAHPSDAVVAPPYDVISAMEREELAARDPHNVVNLTLASLEEDAGRLFRSWLEQGVLVRDEPGVWTLEQSYVGPDGVARVRRGLVASLRVEPYETGSVLPHERTHSDVKEGRLRLLRAARAQVEPIFLLYDGDPPVAVPTGDPDLEAEGTRLWRVDGAGVEEFFADRQLLIADGHHRYETTLAYHAEEGTPDSARQLVVLVSTTDPGLEIFATHRVFSGRPDLSDLATDCYEAQLASVDDALRALAAEPFDRSVVVGYTRKGALLLRGEPGELDVELVDRYGHEGISYTPDASEAVRRVDEGEADAAFLLRPTRIEDVFERARRGQVMPPKTTYFFPKLLSGLLFLPLEP